MEVKWFSKSPGKKREEGNWKKFNKLIISQNWMITLMSPPLKMITRYIMEKL